LKKKVMFLVSVFLIVTSMFGWVYASDSYSSDLTDGLPVSSFTASSEFSSSVVTVSKVFDNIWDTIGKGYYSKERTNQWIRVDFGSERKIAKLRYQADGVTGDYSTGMKNFKVEASIDGSNWELQYTGLTLQNFGRQEFTWSPTGGYRYWRVYIIDTFTGQYNYVGISEMEMMESTSSAAPTNVTALAGNAKVDLSWFASTGATGYNIKRSTTAGGPYTSVASNVTGSPYTDTTVTNGTTYYYVITAVNATGESANSAQVSATPQAPLPAAPTVPTLTGQSGNSQNTLTWTASSGATSYEVKRSTTATGPYTTITNSVYSNVYSTYTDTTAVNGTTYYYVVSASNTGGSSANSNEISLTPQALEPTLNIVIAEEKVKVGQEFTANVELKNVTSIYAEDFTVKYDNTRFDYLGFETVTGHQVYNQPTDQNGNLRFIVASQGVNYGITGEKTFVKLKLRAKAVGVGKVDALKCRIADSASEFDLGEPSCGEDTVTVENMDVNRTGQYTLLDLAIDGYYYGQLASNANPAVYTADQAGDEYVNNDDLVFIVNQMLLNTNYTPNY
jgi:fibronectin type 3 domain-containing protein